ncbi:glycosyl hydrolase family 28-related protein [Chryseobacterium tructae]|uniref:Glycosyl hydrolase family 28-related protein n=1 Tax=Chryseobacterium tructae TaxID=1037380 RepID=A0ABV7XW44_9FLAO|nr:right-handed parallel beta-helix repeat-containing protein [Chryseobacterium tructae]MDN3691676.1 glycosyl hydrolase family 28-related protein [Chryseobacterium tructae]
MKSYLTLCFLTVFVFSFAQNIDIKNYGAKGDGVSDDTNAFTKAVNDINMKYGKQKRHVNLFIPSGTYIISKPIILNKFISITGEFVNSTIIKVKNPNSEAIILERNGDEHIIDGYNYIKSLTLLGPNCDDKNVFDPKPQYTNSTKSTGIKIYGLRTRVEDIQIEGFANNGIEILSAYYTFITNCFIRNNGIGVLLDKESTSVYLTKSEMRYNSIGIYITGRSFANFINNNMIENNLAGYLSADKTSQLSNLKSTGRGIVIDQASNNMINNNYFERHYVSVSVSNSYNNVINNNFFAVNGDGDTANKDKSQTLYQLVGSTSNNMFEKNVTVSSRPAKVIVSDDADLSRNTIDMDPDSNRALKNELMKNRNSSFKAPKIVDQK